MAWDGGPRFPESLGRLRLALKDSDEHDGFRRHGRRPVDFEVVQSEVDVRSGGERIYVFSDVRTEREWRGTINGGGSPLRVHTSGRRIKIKGL